MSYLLGAMEATRFIGEELKVSASRCGGGDREPVGNVLQRLGESFCHAADKMQDKIARATQEPKWPMPSGERDND